MAPPKASVSGGSSSRGRTRTKQRNELSGSTRGSRQGTQVLLVSKAGYAAVNGKYVKGSLSDDGRHIWTKDGDKGFKIQWSRAEKMWIFDCAGMMTPYCARECQDIDVPCGAQWTGFDDDSVLPGPTLQLALEQEAVDAASPLDESDALAVQALAQQLHAAQEAVEEYHQKVSALLQPSLDLAKRLEHIVGSLITEKAATVLEPFPEMADKRPKKKVPLCDIAAGVATYGDNAGANIESLALLGNTSPNPEVVGRKSIEEEVARASQEIDADKAKALSEKKKGKAKRNVYMDADEMKANLKAMLVEKEYNVCDRYHESGVAQAIARHWIFDSLTLTIIFLNSLWLWIDADLNNADTLLESAPIFMVIENMFCLYFVVEWTIRFMAFESKCDGFRDRWFAFDTIVTFFGAFETWILVILQATIQFSFSGNTSALRLLRLLRLTRMARMTKLIANMPELASLIKGMGNATSGVACTMILLVVLTYAFSLALRTLLKGSPVEKPKFASIIQTLQTLLIAAIMPDIEDLITGLTAENLLSAGILFVFVILASLCVLNMLIGIVVDAVNVTSQVETERVRIVTLKENMDQAFKSLDCNNDGLVQKSEFLSVLAQPDAVRALTKVNVDVVSLVDFVDLVYRGKDAISFETFMDTILMLRGSNKATVKDVLDMRKMLELKLYSLEKRILSSVKAMKEAAQAQGSATDNNVAAAAG